jgi:beta-lactamase class A
MSACTSGMLYASHMLRMHTLIAAILVLACSMRALAEQMLERRAREAAGILAEKPAWPEGLFHASFSAQVSDAQLRAIGSQFFGKCGAVESVQQTSSKGPNFGTFDLITAKGFVVPMTIGTEASAPHAVSTLFFGAPAPMLTSLAEATAALGKLDGQVSFGVWKLGDGAMQPIATLEPDRSLAIGSAFKLYVLGALVHAVEAGSRQLSDTATIDAAIRSLPSGLLQDWPEGATVTLDTAANLMISRSDNTATDLLMRTLGRERVEAMLGPMGMQDPARTRPFLTTAEMFRLKFIDGGKAGEAYAALNETERREYLRTKLPGVALVDAALDPGAFTNPSRIDSIEWFASAADLARAMDWLRRNTEPATSAKGLLRGALAINPGLSISETQFPWIGFKGGSEPGVLNLSFLLRRADGAWFSVVATWNDASQSLDEQAFMPLVQRAIWLLGKDGQATESKAP